MKAKVTLVARVNDGTGTFPRASVRIARRAIVLPVEHSGQFHGKDDIIGFYARYSLDGKRRTEPLGKDPLGAYTRFLQIEQDFSRVRAGLLPINDQPKPAGTEDDRSLRACATEFQANIVTLGKSKATVDAYTRAVDALVKQYGDKAIDKIDKKDMLAHLDWLRANLKKRKYGDVNNTFRNRFRNLTVFFNSFGVKNPVAIRELPKSMKPRPTRFSIDMINKFLEVADEDEKDYILFFLESGFRDEEVAYAKYSDLDLSEGSINTHEKPEYNWKPKDSEARQQDIVLRDEFVKRMKARMERKHRKDSDLIFPQKTQEKPDTHLVRIIQRVADRAGITGKRITQHAIRRTFGSMVAKEYGLEQARIWLGHADIETTQAYIAAEEMTTEHSRKKVGDMFAVVRS